MKKNPRITVQDIHVFDFPKAETNISSDKISHSMYNFSRQDSKNSEMHSSHVYEPDEIIEIR